MHKIILSVVLAALCSMVQAQTSPSAKVGPVFKLEKTEYDLGVIGPQQNEVVGNVMISNPGDMPLEIKRVVSSDTCFSEYFGDTTIAPSQEGVLFISYFKNKIAKGPSRQMAQIQTNDSRKPYAAVYFNFTVEHSAQQAEQYQLYKELDSLHQEVRAMREELKSAVQELKAVKNQPAAGSAPQARNVIPDTKIYDVETADSPVLGPKNAKVTIVEFADFQCPYCVAEYSILKEVLKEYPSQVRLVFKHHPLEFHKKAKLAHAAAELARQKLGNEGFWKMHDLLMANPKKLEPEDLSGYAKQIGLDTDTLNDVLKNPQKMDALFEKDMAQAQKCSVTGTPTILINGLKLSPRTPESYRARINQILGK